jgi:uncharacterized membrane protein
MNARHFFSDTEKERIIEAIRAAEAETSGEIRVHVSSKSSHDDVLNSAAIWFARLKMHKTRLRNGVLFYLSVSDRKFAILGDAGINSRVPADFWQNISEQMHEQFANNRFVEGLDEGIRAAGQQLKQHFPRHDKDVNELPDDVSFS